MYVRSRCDCRSTVLDTVLVIALSCISPDIERIDYTARPLHRENSRATYVRYRSRLPLIRLRRTP